MDTVSDIIGGIQKSRAVMSVPYVAKKLNVSQNTVRKCIECGRLEALKLPIGKCGVYRVTIQALERFLKESERNV